MCTKFAREVKKKIKKTNQKLVMIWIEFKKKELFSKSRIFKRQSPNSVS